jgi:hypothetical protein
VKNITVLVSHNPSALISLQQTLSCSKKNSDLHLYREEEKEKKTLEQITQIS